jgi:Trk K+ transport system NAD-binding subunit
LRSAVPDGSQLAATLLRLLDAKDEAHYGVIVVSVRRAGEVVRWAGKLVERAGDEVERG